MMLRFSYGEADSAYGEQTVCAIVVHLHTLRVLCCNTNNIMLYAHAMRMRVLHTMVQRKAASHMENRLFVR